MTRDDLSPLGRGGAAWTTGDLDAVLLETNQRKLGRYPNQTNPLLLLAYSVDVAALEFGEAVSSDAETGASELVSPSHCASRESS